MFETYGKPFICEGNTKNVSLLYEGDPINSSSNWVFGKQYPDFLKVRTSSYRVWDGQEGYIGFQFLDERKKILNGWFHISVNASGSSFTLHDWAYSQDPNATLYAGETSGTGNPPSGDYCSASTDLDYNEITRVQFAGINNASSWNGYSDFTSQTANVSAGQSYPLEISVLNGHWPDVDVQAWVDWNSDRDFNDENEYVYFKRGSGSFNGTVSVPSSAQSGTTRMRVRLAYGNTPGPCGVDTYMGEVEDYSVNISGGALAVREPTVMRTISLYPNPNEGLFMVKLNRYDESWVTLKIVNMEGKVVYEKISFIQKEAPYESVNLRNYPKGLYNLLVISKDHLGTQKIVVK
ncbi:GEVED domain-containing protein [Xanthovirga aplysinae]|uniref:GEVED domain-containing protein n=1 Tax=Xanthovirga aplysinae TaxID=2529853 RepID=UPI0012BC4205|nr:GEVED domain-containing protein [Xanthovirga aplysinae]MTI30393.1 T9SS type A sorting domain-containing protein [Xanthovirga aplysinae]